MFSFLFFYVWSELGPVIQVEPGVFKTNYFNPLIVRLANNDKSAESYAQVLADNQKPASSTLEIPTCDSFIINTIHEHAANNGDRGILVNTIHKQSQESFILYVYRREI